MINKTNVTTSKVKIVHIFNNGTKLSTIKGLKVALSAETSLSYEILAGNYSVDQ